MSKETISLWVNEAPHRVEIEPGDSLLVLLRDRLGLTGTKNGCGEGQCGACTVHLDGQVTRACVTPISSVGAKQVTTIEAIGQTKTGEAVQKAWLDVDVMQCGYCQAGQIMAATALIGTQQTRMDFNTISTLLPAGNPQSFTSPNATQIVPGLDSRLGTAYSFRLGSGIVKIEAENGQQAVVNVIGYLNERDLQIASLEILEPNLESVFLHLTGKKLRE
mgnify:CR=1 FL=1